MVAVARAMMSGPRLLLLDEPSLGLAPRMVDEMLAIVRRIADGGTTVLMVEQNVRKALAAADRGYVLERGRVVAEGAAAELARSSRVRQAYLGQGSGAAAAAATPALGPPCLEVSLPPVPAGAGVWQVSRKVELLGAAPAAAAGRRAGIMGRTVTDPAEQEHRHRATHPGPAAGPGGRGARRPRQPAPRDREGEAGAERPAHGAAARGERPAGAGGGAGRHGGADRRQQPRRADPLDPARRAHRRHHPGADARPAAERDRPGAAQLGAGRPAVPRPRRLQADQRHPRPRRRRPGAAPGGGTSGARWCANRTR